MPGGIDSYEVLSKQYPCVNICARSDLQKSLDSSCFRIALLRITESEVQNLPFLPLRFESSYRCLNKRLQVMDLKVLVLVNFVVLLPVSELFYRGIIDMA